MTLTKFIFRCGPIMLVAALFTAAGVYLGRQIPLRFSLWFAIAALVLLLTLQIFKNEKGWNFTLLLMMALVAGVSMNRLDLSGAGWFSWFACFLGLVVSILWAYVLGVRLGWMGILFFPLILLYLLGWMFSALVFELAPLAEIWPWIGLFLFLGLGIYLLTEARFTSGTESAVPLGSDLYVVYFNLFWLGAVLADQWGFSGLI